MSTETTIVKLEKRLRKLDAEIQALEQERRSLAVTVQALKAKEYIEEHGMRKQDVQRSEGKGIPYHHTCWRFADWLRETECDKPWAEWNTQIHETKRLMKGVYEPTPVTLEHLEIASK